ncbi:MAG: CRISPR-associated protein Cas4 [Candidatus Heimdallarchaeota archaeon]
MSTIEFTAEDFRQHTYCPRIIYFRYVMRIIPYRTYKMQKGTEYHDEKIRRKTKTKKENAVIYYNKFIVDQKLGLAALLDAIVEENGSYYPIEYKTGKAYTEIPKHHLKQLVLQAIIIENYFKTNVEKAEVRYSSGKRITTPITLEMKMDVLKQHTEMLRIVLDETIPEPTEHTGKCQDCEFRLVCKRA